MRNPPTVNQLSVDPECANSVARHFIPGLMRGDEVTRRMKDEGGRMKDEGFWFPVHRSPFTALIAADKHRYFITRIKTYSAF